MKQQFTKTKTRKSASGSSSYNKDLNHRDHKDRTYIINELHYQSKALEEHGWEFIDKYERENKKSRDANNQAREYMESLPNSWVGDIDKIVQWRNKTIEQFSQDLGEDKDNLFIEIDFHYNYADKNGNVLPEDKRNLHAHILIGERALIRNAEPERYGRDSWLNTDTGKAVFKEPVNGYLLHKKGDIKHDKDGSIKYKEEPLSTKFSIMKSRMWLQRVKERQAEIKMSIDPSLELQVGRDIDRLPMITYNRAEERLYPERVEMIKEINDDRREINRTYKRAEKEKVMIKEQVKTEIDFHFEMTRVETIDMSPSKISYWQKIKSLTKEWLRQLFDFLNHELEEKQKPIQEQPKEPIQQKQEPVFLYSWNFGYQLDADGRGAIKYDFENHELTFVNSNHNCFVYEIEFANKEQLLKSLEQLGVSQIEDLENTSMEHEYKSLFAEIEKGRNIEPEKNRGLY